MRPEAQRIAIAEACGWKHYGCTGCACSPCVCSDWIHESTDFMPEKLPDYLSDLNAMHEAEETLSDMQCEIYRSELSKALAQAMAEKFGGNLPPAPQTWIWHAPASVRAVAFLRTLDLYQP